MFPNPDACYRAVQSRDPRLDGYLFVGVSSTGVYCRPVCGTRTPRRENCRYFPSAAAAEHAGFRPCLRCRPELAPGLANVDAVRRLGHTAARQIDRGALVDGDLAALAGRLGVGVRHLRRVFVEEFGVPPVAYAQTQRLLLAKRLLTETQLTVMEIAMVAGFGSVRRLNALFRERYRLRPSGLRRGAERASTSSVVLELAFRPPYAWNEQISFLGARAIAGVEAVDDGAYRRAVALTRRSESLKGWIEVTLHPSRDALRVALSAELMRALPEALERTRRLFDLNCQPDEVSATLGPLGADCPGLRVPGAFDGFEMAVRAILGQQVTIRAARTLVGRVVARYGERVVTPWESVGRTFPSPLIIAQAHANDLGALGITRRRALALTAVARGVVDQSLVLEPGADPETQIGRLRALPGIGNWTAHYIAMRALAWPDALPHPDYGVMKALGEQSPGRVLARAEAWRPWRAYATLHLWRALSAGDP